MPCKNPKIIAATDDTFDKEVLNSDLPVLVKYWASWCAPCKALAPVVDDLANEYEGRVQFVKLDVDDNPNSCNSYKVRGIPTLVLFKDGEEVDRVVGAVPKTQIQKLLDLVLPKKAGPPKVLLNEPDPPYTLPISEQRAKFQKDLAVLINQHSMENTYNTPDYILAEYLTNCLYSFAEFVNARSDWYGHHDAPGRIEEPEEPHLFCE